MRKLIYSILFALLPLFCFAQETVAESSEETAEPAAAVTEATDAVNNAAWTTANELYAGGNYQDAVLAYENILTETPSADVYYNLGNAYFKIGEVAQSILAYERALRLRPNFKDAQHNLRFAEAKIIDNIEDHSQFFLSQWALSFRNLTGESTWFILSVVFFLLCLVGAFVFAFCRATLVRKIGFHGAWVALVISIAMLCCASSLHHRDSNREEAIILQGIVNAKSAPDKSGTDLFVLHEGTKVRIKDSVNEWVEIHVGDNVGWIRANALERI